MDRVRQVVENFAEAIMRGQMQNKSGQYEIPIHTDGANSPIVARIAGDANRSALYADWNDKTKVIAVVKPGQKVSHRYSSDNLPPEAVVSALEYRVTERQASEIDREELGQEMAKILREYLADRTPDTAIVVEYTPRPSEEIVLSPKYLDNLRAQGRYVQDSSARGLTAFVPTGHYETYPKKDEEVLSGPYQSPYGLKSAHADDEGIFVVQVDLSEAVELLSQRAGWRLSRNGHKPQNSVK